MGGEKIAITELFCSGGSGFDPGAHLLFLRIGPDEVVQKDLVFVVQLRALGTALLSLSLGQEKKKCEGRNNEERTNNLQGADRQDNIQVKCECHFHRRLSLAPGNSHHASRCAFFFS